MHTNHEKGFLPTLLPTLLPPLLLLGSTAWAVKIDTYDAVKYPILKIGADDEDAGILKALLSLQGAFGDENGVCYEMNFGNGTKKAVLAFQKSHKLTQDGIVGPKTWQALLDFPVLKLGSKGPMVKNLQQFFNYYNYVNITRTESADMSAETVYYKKLLLKPDGIFGKQTEARIKEQQKLYELKVDGIVGVRTWHVLAFKMPQCNE